MLFYICFEKFKILVPTLFVSHKFIISSSVNASYFPSLRSSITVPSSSQHHNRFERASVPRDGMSGSTLHCVENPLGVVLGSVAQVVYRPKARGKPWLGRKGCREVWNQWSLLTVNRYLLPVLPRLFAIFHQLKSPFLADSHRLEPEGIIVFLPYCQYSHLASTLLVI